MSTVKPTLTLVDFPGRGFIYPLSSADNDVLLDHKVTTCVIPRDLLPSLRSSLLKGVKIVTQPGRSTIRDLTQTFMNSLEGVRFKESTGELRMKFEASRLEEVRASTQLLTTYFGRYGFSANFEWSVRGSVVVGSYAWSFNPDLNVALYFEDVQQPDSDEFVLNTSPVFRMVMRKQPSRVIPGHTSVLIEFQDKIGEQFVTTVSRSFDLQGFNRTELLSGSTFLMNLIASVGGK